MKTVQAGTTVNVHYKGTFPDGEVFDDSRARGIPMKVMVGTGQLIPGFDNALIGMTEGEVKTVNIASDDAYGPRFPQAIFAAPRTSFPEDFPFEIGTPVAGKNAEGLPVRARIVSFTDEEVVLDHNHPLAGKDLNFEIEVVAIDEEQDTKSLTDYTVKELRAFAKEKGIKGFSTMKKAELVESLSN
tara:strand:- start:71 stop:628 length:558 start_codon:yes stop_codon:yes gene_type:complete